MRPRILALAALAIIVYGCASTAPLAPPPAEPLHGVASWYGEEFAGRTTANGEIFDPLLLTAAHRSLPFGTVLDITNPKTTQTVRVRINDRGPYIGNRLIDLSYAAAQVIGLIEPGIGEVDIKIVHLGNGEREPPAPMEVTIAEAPKTVSVIAAGEPPKVDFPIPAAKSEPVVVDRIDVKTVAADGTTIIGGAAGFQPAETAGGLKAHRSTIEKQFIVQVGAFAVETNATLLLDRIKKINQQAFIDHHDLFRVRIGPFATRELAQQARAALEANGMSAIIVAE
ncbi:MAG TPA: septal ring lytic transglycosylase RlpA family protein [Thermoanaerobaculia bacterium]|nr:septal ring lytic transglycosylase RlpA family protein [Thermoanaerobaculia bacterium]